MFGLVLLEEELSFWQEIEQANQHNITNIPPTSRLLKFVKFMNAAFDFLKILICFPCVR